jgi:hypothetical protein
MTLENAEDDIKLAVDLIQILEENNLKNETIIAALKITLKDFERKQQNDIQNNKS